MTNAGRNLRMYAPTRKSSIPRTRSLDPLISLSLAAWLVLGLRLIPPLVPPQPLAPRP
jgi:hypothetical protein